MNGSALIDKLNRFPLQQVTVNGRRLAYREAGSGPVLLLLHGISSGSGSWVQQLESLSAQYRVIAWDAPGYGGSDALATDTPTAMDYAAALLALVDALALAQPLLVGHSLGALQASAFAGMHGDRLSGLVLADPAQGYGQADPATQQDIFRKRPAMLEALGAEGLARERAPALLSPKASAEKVALVADGMQRLNMAGFSAASWLLAHDDIWRYLPDYQRPLLVLCGDEDSITPPASAVALAVGCNKAGYVALPQAGHASYIDAPEAFAAAIADYAQGLACAQGLGQSAFSGGEQ
ncbi:alpha/beta fold hydrolase [Marinobacterium sedimentorum]|uniref:alpha/beta fold hydrolase n=1 Tax=Marinobacterium sedimentorum TaxID=2927804 RepID=UPI0020C61C7E|nr:alpha/beta hydrolase [Marinobacterium sedimentorum]MCP8687677.1 alpha/beta hydrolase [Marinobacterium sedimentorum]